MQKSDPESHDPIHLGHRMAVNGATKAGGGYDVGEEGREWTHIEKGTPDSRLTSPPHKKTNVSITLFNNYFRSLVTVLDDIDTLLEGLNLPAIDVVVLGSAGSRNLRDAGSGE